MSDIGSGEKRAAMVLAAVLAAASVEAEDRLTLVEAVTRALSYYPSVQASAAQVEVADAALDEAEAARFPTVSVRASATRYQEPMLVHPIHAFTPDLIPPFDQNLFQALVDVHYSLFDGGGRSAGIEENRARRQIDPLSSHSGEDSRRSQGVAPHQGLGRDAGKGFHQRGSAHRVRLPESF